jgi:hypothetical protein
LPGITTSSKDDVGRTSGDLAFGVCGAEGYMNGVPADFQEFPHEHGVVAVIVNNKDSVGTLELWFFSHNLERERVLGGLHPSHYVRG